MTHNLVTLSSLSFSDVQSFLDTTWVSYFSQMVSPFPCQATNDNTPLGLLCSKALNLFGQATAQLKARKVKVARHTALKLQNLVAAMMARLKLTAPTKRDAASYRLMVVALITLHLQMDPSLKVLKN